MIFIGLFQSKTKNRVGKKDFLGFYKFLRQQKFSYKILEDFNDIKKNKPSLLILPSIKSIKKEDWKILEDYVSAGGNLIASFETFNKNLFGCSVSDKKMKICDLKIGDELKQTQTVLYDINGKLPVRIPGLIVKNQNSRELASLLDEKDQIKGAGIVLHNFNQGKIFYFAVPIGMSLNNFTYGEKREFFVKFPKLHHRLIIFFRKLKHRIKFTTFIKKLITYPVGYEYTNVKTKYRTLTMKTSEFLIETLLKEIINKCFDNIPLINIGYWPNNKKATYIQRIDVDGLEILNHYKILDELCKKYKIKLSLFCNTSVLFYDKKNFDEVNVMLKFLKEHNHQIGTHGVTQKISHSLWETSINKLNKKDIENMFKESISYLNQILANEKYFDFATPYENANEKVFEVCEKLGIKSISSGNIGCDGLPYFCIGSKKEYNLLHIPNSVADLYEDHKLPLDFFKEMIANKIKNNSLICLYFHPDYFEKHKDDINNLWQLVSSDDIWRPTFEELREWWYKRDKISFEYSFINNIIFITIQNNNDTPISFTLNLSKKSIIIDIEKKSEIKIKI